MSTSFDHELKYIEISETILKKEKMRYLIDKATIKLNIQDFTMKDNIRLLYNTVIHSFIDTCGSHKRIARKLTNKVKPSELSK